MNFPRRDRNENYKSNHCQRSHRRIVGRGGGVERMTTDNPTLSSVGEANIRARYGTLNVRLGRVKGRLFNAIGQIEEIQLAVHKEEKG